MHSCPSFCGEEHFGTLSSLHATISSGRRWGRNGRKYLGPCDTQRKHLPDFWKWAYGADAGPSPVIISSPDFNNFYLFFEGLIYGSTLTFPQSILSVSAMSGALYSHVETAEAERGVMWTVGEIRANCSFVSSRGGSALYEKFSDVSQICIEACRMLKLGFSSAPSCMQTHLHPGMEQRRLMDLFLYRTGGKKVQESQFGAESLSHSHQQHRH